MKSSVYLLQDAELFQAFNVSLSTMNFERNLPRKLLVWDATSSFKLQDLRRRCARFSGADPYCDRGWLVVSLFSRLFLPSPLVGVRCENRQVVLSVHPQTDP